MTTPRRRKTATELLNALLDKGYTSATSALTRARAQELRSGRLARSFDDLITEAQRLADEGKRFDRNNPILRVFMADVEDSLQFQLRIAQGLGPDLQANGIEAARKLFPEITFGMSERNAARIIAGFNMPSIEAITSSLDFISQQAFADMLSNVTPDTLKVLQRIISQGIVSGQGPLRTARLLQRTAGAYPGYYFNNLMRTLQLESYRNGQLAIEVANARLFEKKIRIETLDDRICLACIPLHGQEMAIGEKVREHHQGRGTAILVVKGREVNVQKGTDWFKSLPEERQQQQNSFKRSPAKYEAYRQGKLQLEDFVTDYQDDLFGEMLRENSLKGVLGEQAKEFYR